MSVLQHSSFMLSITVYLKTVLGRSPRGPRNLRLPLQHYCNNDQNKHLVLLIINLR